MWIRILTRITSDRRIGPKNSTDRRICQPLFTPSPRTMLRSRFQSSSLSLNLVPWAFSSFERADRRNPWPRLPKWLQKFVRISSHKHDEMSSFRLNNGFRLQKTNRAARHWKKPLENTFRHVSRDKILHDSGSIARVSPIRHFE